MDKYIRFKEDIKDGEDTIWVGGILYRIAYDFGDCYVADSCGDGRYGIEKELEGEMYDVLGGEDE